MTNCPKCNHPMYEEVVNTEYECKTYFDYMIAHCDRCGKTWEWVDTFTFLESSEMREVNEDC